jgi:drug/metabolite transporter (DMT)-like permease
MRWSDAPWLLLMAVTGLAGQVFIVKAFKHGHAAVVAPFEYSALAWGVLFDALLWQVWPASHTLWGALLVIVGGLVLLKAAKQS